MSFYENIHNGNFEEAIKLLIDKGADINFKDKYGNTVLMNACIMNNTELVKLLLENGADINAKDKDGYTALDLASINENNENNEIIKILENAGAN